MKYLLSFLMIAFLSVTSIAQENDHDNSRFRQAKDAVKMVLVHIAKKYGGTEYNEGKLNGFIADTSLALASVKKEFPEIEYSVTGDKEINSPQAMAKNFMFITTYLEYKDEQGKITWEFPVVFGANEVNFFSTEVDGTVKKFDDYYRWFHMQKKIEEDKENRTEQGL